MKYYEVIRTCMGTVNVDICLVYLETPMMGCTNEPDPGTVHISLGQYIHLYGRTLTEAVQT